MIGPMERALFLRSLEPLDNMQAEDIPVFAEHARERYFRAGEALFRRGERPRSFHIVVEGTVRVAGGEYLDGLELSVREAVGFLSMVAAHEEGIEAMALDDVVTLEFDDEVFYDILEDNFAITDGLIRRLAAGTLSLRQRVPSGAYLSPDDFSLELPDRPLNLVERILLLRRPNSPFQSASLEAIVELARSTPQISLPANHTIWKTGDRSDHTLILLSGSVSCTTQWGISRFRAGPGYPLGNLERFSRDPRWYTAVTETPVVALHSGTETLLDVLEDNFDMTLALIRAMAQRVISISVETGARAATPTREVDTGAASAA